MMLIQMQEGEQIKNQKGENACTGEFAVRWERFLPRMALRVLLVEADDSTRQIIAALLRKCNYRVAAVPDGLKAWETLKDKALDIDLILTEVELPSISGFSLLTLIMEHDVCKNIPVILMSTHDSVSMVYKCMLKGAADFLIKPVRRNELRNLWQHVWRRHAISRSSQSLALPHNKLEVAAENNAASISSGSVASPQKNNECSQRTNDAQGTCTSPILEAKNAYLENMQDTSQLKISSNLSNMDVSKHEDPVEFERESAKHNDEGGLRLDQGYGYNETENEDDALRTESIKVNPHMNTEIHECSDEMVEPSRGAIDLIATFDNLPKSTDDNCSFNGDNASKFDFDTQLELSLRSDFPDSSCKPATEERQILNHSNASAFSRYGCSKLFQPLFPSPSITSAKLSNVRRNSDDSHKLPENTSTFHQFDGKSRDPNVATLVTGQTGQVEPKSPNSQHEVFPAATGFTSDHKSAVRGNVFPSMFHSQSGDRPICTPKSVCPKESSPFPTSASSQSNPESHNSEQHRWSEDAIYTSDQNVNDHQSNLDFPRQDSSATGQSAGSSFHHETHISSGAYGSIGSGGDANAASSAVLAKNNPESVIVSSHQSNDGSRGTDAHHTSQREAALTKFRLKRKDRCFEKKVRYQSRKRLAEQRPRVKGQFVRQVHSNHPVADAGGGS